MSATDPTSTAAEALSHPVVLWGAWLRVDSWYKHGQFAPEPEMSRWRLHPEAQLRELASDLRGGKWEPETWPQVPYPKKGSCLRHYTMPTVRDQVAFMAHLVLLGPIFDSHIPTFAFGNRWYRPIGWDRRSAVGAWVHRPYPMTTDKIYQPYARSYGLFRRVAHWTVAQMTEARLPKSDYAGRVQHPEDYASDALPKWTRGSWWRDSGDGRRAFWAGVDIELAYPSIRLDRLEEAVIAVLREPVDLVGLFQDCPGEICRALGEEEVRTAVGGCLMRALRMVQIEPGGVPRKSWAPPRKHKLPKVTPEKDVGIPTGLAISGMLLNVALLEVDRAVDRYLDATTGDRRGAVVRFADDMYLLSRTAGGVLDLVEAVHVALSGTAGGSLATPNEGSNLCLNFAKIKPEAIRDVVEKYLQTQGWGKCKTCGQPLPGSGAEDAAHPPISDWWEDAKRHPKFAARSEAVERTAIAEGDVGPFVTSLVERLSEMGADTLRERFGEGARGYLARLHELARFDIDDEQVRADTRRSFAVNRLVRAWLPGEAEPRDIRDIRDTVAFVLRETPWKFVVWRAVVRAAARRGHGGSGGGRAKEWLRSQLRRIADGGAQSGSWVQAWPEEGAERRARQGEGQKVAGTVCVLPQGGILACVGGCRSRARQACGTLG